MAKKRKKKTNHQKQLERRTVEYPVGMDLFGQTIYVTHFI